MIEGRSIFSGDMAQANPATTRSICLTFIALAVLIGLASIDLGDHPIHADEDLTRESASVNTQVEASPTLVDTGDTEGLVVTAETDLQTLVNERKESSGQMNELEPEE